MMVTPDGRKMKKNIIGSLNGIQYIGMDYGDNNWKRNLNAYALGILDEENHTMTAIPVDHIFVMRPTFPDKTVKITKTTSLDGNYAERRQSLTDEFGSKKKQRALKAAQSNTILAENISGSDTVQRLVATTSAIK